MVFPEPYMTTLIQAGLTGLTGFSFQQNLIQLILSKKINRPNTLFDVGRSMFAFAKFLGRSDWTPAGSGDALRIHDKGGLV